MGVWIYIDQAFGVKKTTQGAGWWRIWLYDLQEFSPVFLSHQSDVLYLHVRIVMLRAYGWVVVVFFKATWVLR